MERADKELAFLLRYENIARYEDGAVYILDRRVYPGTVRYEVCRTHQEVAKAVKDMVTQSAGPFTAVAMGMALAARECRGLSPERQREYLKNASYTLSHSRVTTVKRYAQITEGCRKAAEEALERGEDTSEAIVRHTYEANNGRYRKVEVMAGHLCSLIPEGGTVLTQCFGETIIGMLAKVSKERGMRLNMVCAETRPYFQGARLTASVLCDMCLPVTVISDNMPARYMQEKGVDVFTSAADAICADGYVFNKVGTFQLAIVSKYMGVPYYVTGAPDFNHKTHTEVTIEQRDPELVLEAMGVRTAMRGVSGYYPAFDETPPELIRGVVTDRGVFSPFELARYLDLGPLDPFELIL